MSNPTPAPDELDLDYIFGYFHQAYDTDFDKIHKRYLAGEITIEQHVKLSEKSWHKHLTEAKSQILAYVDKRERLARIDEVEKTIEICSDAIESWSKHAYSMDSFINDQLVYSGKADKARKERRNDDVADRRAILLASGMKQHLADYLAELKSALTNSKVTEGE